MLSGQLAATDPDGSDAALSYALDTDVDNGMLVLNSDGSYTCTPDSNWSGTDTFTYAVTDAAGGTSTATVTLNVAEVNDAPVLVGSAAADILEDVGSVSLDVLSTATDVDASDVLSVAAVSDGANRTVAINADGTVSYTPNEGAYDSLAAGETATDTFTYTISDGAGGTVTGTATVNVTGTNDAPTLVGSASADILEDAGSVSLDVLSTATDVDASDVLSVAAVTDGANGTVAINADGTVSYTPNEGAYDSLAAGETATDTFTYSISDGEGGTVTGTATVNVTGTNDAPTLVGSASADILEDAGSVSLNVLSTATDVDASDVLSVAAVSDGANGTVAINADGTVSYTPSEGAYDSLADGETATDTFTYTISDGAGGTVTGTATVNVTGTNDAPTLTGSASADILEDAGFGEPGCSLHGHRRGRLGRAQRGGGHGRSERHRKHQRRRDRELHHRTKARTTPSRRARPTTDTFTYTISGRRGRHGDGHRDGQRDRHKRRADPHRQCVGRHPGGRGLGEPGRAFHGDRRGRLGCVSAWRR